MGNDDLIKRLQTHRAQILASRGGWKEVTPLSDDLLEAIKALSQAYERGQADSRIAFIEWLRPWAKRRFGKWITHNTATGAFNDYQEAIRSLPIEQDSEVKG